MVTLQDIADIVGVSRATVSLALSGKHEKLRLNADTCKKIRQTARELGYLPNEIARSMITGRSRVCGFYSRGIQADWSGRVVAGILEELDGRGYYLKLLSNGPNPTVDDAKEVARACVAQCLCGVVCHSLPSGITRNLRDRLTLHNIPLATVGSSFEGDCSIRVNSDDMSGMELGVSYLRRLGHQRLGYVSTNTDKGYSALRHRGFEAALKKRSMACNEGYCVFNDDLDELEQACCELFAQSVYPTAVLCCSDPVAMLALRAAHRVNRRIPQDISILGFADIAFASLTYPSLTTIRQPFMEMGRRVAQLLLDEVESHKTESPKEKIDCRIPVCLVERDSTGPVAG